MKHSVTFGEKNTWKDWRLVPTSRPVLNPPPQKVKQIDIPGGDGVLDLSTSLTGYPVFENRTGSMEFYVTNGFRPWNVAYSDMMNYLHGQTMRVLLQDEPEYYYEGRLVVNSWQSNEANSLITIDYDLGPYKWELLSSTDPWLWDPFSFQTGIIRETLFKDIEVTTAKTLHEFSALVFGKAPVSPEFTTTTTEGRGAWIHFKNPTLGIDVEKNLTEGQSWFPEMVFFGDQGASVELWTSEGSGTVSIDFRIGRL